MDKNKFGMLEYRMLASKGISIFQSAYKLADEWNRTFLEITDRLAIVSKALGYEMLRLKSAYGKHKRPTLSYKTNPPIKPNRTRKKQRLTRLKRRLKRQR